MKGGLSEMKINLKIEGKNKHFVLDEITKVLKKWVSKSDIRFSLKIIDKK